jgi:hypothetical protein
MITSPAAAPLMPSEEPLNGATNIPPTILAINPEYNGAPQARAMPRDIGIAIKKIARPAEKSYCKFLNSIIDKTTKIIIRHTKN